MRGRSVGWCGVVRAGGRVGFAGAATDETKRPREWQAPEVSSPRRGRFLLRWVAPRSLKKPGLRRKGEEHPGVGGPTCIRVRRRDEPPCSDRLRARGHRGARGRSQAGLDVEVVDARRRASAGTGMRDAGVDGGGRSTSGVVYEGAGSGHGPQSSVWHSLDSGVRRGAAGRRAGRSRRCVRGQEFRKGDLIK